MHRPCCPVESVLGLEEPVEHDEVTGEREKEMEVPSPFSPGGLLVGRLDCELGYWRMGGRRRTLSRIRVSTQE